MNFKTKARGMWATFAFDCPCCRCEATVSNARPDPHTCPEREQPITSKFAPNPGLDLEQILTALDNRQETS